MGVPLLERPSREDLTVNVTRPVARSGGSCAWICVGDVLNSGIATSFAVTQTPARILGSGVPDAVAESARLFPLIVITPPGDNEPTRFAPLMTPVSCGVRPAAGVTDTTLNPERVSTYTSVPLRTIPRRSSCVWLFTPSSRATGLGGQSRAKFGCPI